MVDKKIDSYLKQIKIRQVNDLDKEIVKVFGQTKAKEYLETLESLWEADSINLNSSENKDNQSRQSKKTAFMNSNKKLSILISSYYDFHVFPQFMQIILDNKKFIGNTVLDVGCGNGIISCFIAKLFPRTQVVGLDTCENSISIANEIKNQLQLHNITFFTELPEEKRFDTIISMRAFHENIGSLRTNDSYRSTSYMISTYTELHRRHSSYINKLLSDNGTLISVERYSNNEVYYGLLNALDELGITCDVTKIKQLKVKEGDSIGTFQFSRFTKTNSHRLD